MQLVNALSQTLSAEIVTVRDTQPSKQKQSCPAHQKRVVILRTSDKMNLPYSVVAARIPRQPTPHRPSRSQATVVVEDANTVSFPKEANNVHTQGISQSPHPLPKFTSTSCPPKDSSESCQEWQRLATYLTVSHLIEVSNEPGETKNILKKKAITKLLGDDILQTAITQLSSIKKDIDSTSKLVKPVDSTANQIDAIALVKGKKSKKKTANFPSQSKITTNDNSSAEEEFQYSNQANDETSTTMDI